MQWLSKRRTETTPLTSRTFPVASQLARRSGRRAGNPTRDPFSYRGTESRRHRGSPADQYRRIRRGLDPLPSPPYPRPRKPPLFCARPCPLRVASRDVTSKLDEAAAPAGRIRIRHSGDAGAPPGTTTSPCQELAEGFWFALSLRTLSADRKLQSAARHCMNAASGRAGRRPHVGNGRAAILRTVPFGAP